MTGRNHSKCKRYQQSSVPVVRSFVCFRRSSPAKRDTSPSSILHLSSALSISTSPTRSGPQFCPPPASSIPWKPFLDNPDFSDFFSFFFWNTLILLVCLAFLLIVSREEKVVYQTIFRVAAHSTYFEAKLTHFHKPNSLKFVFYGRLWDPCIGLEHNQCCWLKLEKKQKKTIVHLKILECCDFFFPIRT